MFKLNTQRSLYQKTRGIYKGLFPIPYEVRVLNGDWSELFGKYQNQKWASFDTNSCWCLSAINCIEDQLEWLWKNNMFSKEAKDFFTGYGYIDADGDFSLSERYLEILSGRTDGGSSQEEAWKLAKSYGLIPRSLLNYTDEKAHSFYNQNDFVIDYFGRSNITQGMRDLGKQFLKYVKIDYQQIGRTWATPDKNALRDALRQAPVQIGIPVPYNWNVPNVEWDGSYDAAHAIELYAITNDGKYKIFDQYLPNLKTLSADYYIAIATQGVVTAIPQPIVNTTPVSIPIPINPVSQETVWAMVWRAVSDFLEKWGLKRRLG